METKTLLSCKNLFKTYGEGEGKFFALNDVSLDIYEGEFLVILGSSGSGKSTLLNSIGGMDSVSGGSIIFKDKDIAKCKVKELTEYRKNNIGFVFQFFNLLNELTVEQNIRIAPNAYKDKSKTEELLNRLGLGDKKKKFPNQLSGGQQQRVAIARSINKPFDLLLADEPTGALDYESGKEVLQILEDINKNEHKTVVLVTHTKEISFMADRVCEMRNGKITNITVNKDKKLAKDIDW